jgi:hypothetical protein
MRTAEGIPWEEMIYENPRSTVVSEKQSKIPLFLALFFHKALNLLKPTQDRTGKSCRHTNCI